VNSTRATSSGSRRTEARFEKKESTALKNESNDSLSVALRAGDTA